LDEGSVPFDVRVGSNAPMTEGAVLAQSGRSYPNSIASLIRND
jgi:hypothetical protein